MKILLPTAVSLLLAACAGTPSVHYYTLPDSAFALPQHAGRAVALDIKTAVPAGGGLVYRTGRLNLNTARQNLWAAPLDDMLAARFANELNRRSRSYRYFPAGRAPAGAIPLTVYIEAFNGSYTGHTEIRGHSLWPDGSGSNFAVETPQTGDGYPAMVDSLSDGIGSAAGRIVR